MNRLLRDLIAHVRAALPELPYLSTYRYRVVMANPGDQRWMLQPVSKARGLSDISPVELHPGMAGLVAELATGSEVLVAFVEGDPSQPVILAHQAPDKPGWLPTTLTLDASSTVHVGPSAGLVELGSGDETLVSPLEAGRVIRYGDTVVFATAAPPVPPVMSSGVQYVVTAGLPATPVSVARVRA